jgi:hypothetical protein
MEYLDFHVISKFEFNIFIRQDWRLHKRAPFDLVPFWYHGSFFFALGLCVVCGKNKQRKTRTNMSIPRDRGGSLLALLLFFCIDNAEAQTWTWIGGSSVADSDSANAPVKGVPSSATWPNHRYHHVGWVPYQGSSTFYIFGGFLSGSLYADMWGFNYETQGKNNYFPIVNVSFSVDMVGWTFYITNINHIWDLSFNQENVYKFCLSGRPTHGS